MSANYTDVAELFIEHRAYGTAVSSQWTMGLLPVKL